MADCIQCGQPEIGINSTGMNATFCSRACRKAWHLENKNGFTVFLGDSPDVVEGRNLKNVVIQGAIEQAVIGSRGAKRWLRQKARLLAIWDSQKQTIIRL